MNTIQWWCSAQPGQVWTWSFQAYPGIWIFMLAIGAAYAGALRWARGRERSATRKELTAFGVGYLLLWAVLDWPLGPLAAGYLLTAHMTQYLLIVLLIVPLLDAGMPGWMVRRVCSLPPLGWLVARPVVTFALLNGMMVATHLPVLVDALKPLQFGSMAIDLAWIGSALVFWWSVRTDAPEAERAARYGKRMLYVAGIKMLPIFLGAFFVFAEFPLFKTFELAARATPLSALEDQILAGLIMWMGTTPILLYRLGAAWFSWVALEARSSGP